MAQHSDSGFSSVSNCSYLPPPPPYRGKWKAPARPSSSIESNDFALHSSSNASSIPAISPTAASSIQNLATGCDRSQAVESFIRYIEGLSQPKSPKVQEAGGHKIHRSLSDSKYGTIVNLINSVANAVDRSAALRASSSGGRLNAHRGGGRLNPHKWKNWKAARSANNSAHTSTDGDFTSQPPSRLKLPSGALLKQLERRRLSGSQSSDPLMLPTNTAAFNRRFSAHSWTTESRLTNTSQIISSLVSWCVGWLAGELHHCTLPSIVPCVYSFPHRGRGFSSNPTTLGKLPIN